ncbi:hypothetical protein ACHAWC_007085 [Mediolabrus comicus]
MGNEASTYQDGDGEDYPEEFAKFDGIETLGYRVLGVQPNSPASAAGLVSFLDFLVGVNGEMLMGSGEGLEEGDEYDDIDFPALLKENNGKELELLVHNIKSNTQRFVKITPSSEWGGAGLLGVTIRLDDYGGSDERLIRVLSVEHNSPAAIAGLTPMTDYLLGTTSTSFDTDSALAEVIMVHADRIVEIFDTDSALAEVIMVHADRIVEMYVYNSETDLVRVVTLMPTLSWGGRGLLGAEVGTGYLHGFPKTCRGTDGASVERKIRMGVRPTEKAMMKEEGETKRGGHQNNESNGQNGHVATEEPLLRQQQEEEDAGSEQMVDLINDTMSGKAMVFAEQMEMEPEPEREEIDRPIPSQPESPHAHERQSSEADDVFNSPPPK